MCTHVVTGDSDLVLAALIARMSAGEVGALRELYDTAADHLYGIALRISGARHIAEEAVSETFLQAWRTASSYAPARGAPLAWLAMICRSRTLDLMRREEVQRGRAAEDALAEIAQEITPEYALAALERASAVRAALAALPTVQRQLVALAYFRGLSHSELSVATRLPLGTVKTHMRNALKALRAQLGAPGRPALEKPVDG